MSNMETFEFKPKAHYRIIEVRESLGKEIIERLVWDNLRLEIILKWEWYFNYRAALLQIKYPRYRVEIKRGQRDPEGLTKVQIDNRVKKNRITTCKRMITKITNALKAYENEESSKLLPDWEFPAYIKSKKKLEHYQNELVTLTGK